MDELKDKRSIEDAGEVEAITGKRVRVDRSGGDTLLPASVVGGFIGMLVGTLPVVIWFMVFRFTFSPMYVFLPLFVYLGLKLFGGFRGRMGLITLCGFTVLGFFFTLLSVEAAVDILRYGMTIFNVPLVAVTLIGQQDVLAGPLFSSAYVFPLIFSLLGVFISEELLMRKRRPSPAPEPNTADHTGRNAE